MQPTVIVTSIRLARRRRAPTTPARRARLERTLYLIAYFSSHPCVDCGESDPIVLEFDHLNDKDFSIGAKLCTRNWASILREIGKCEVVCSNCHRRRTAHRRGALRAVLTQK